MIRLTHVGQVEELRSDLHFSSPLRNTSVLSTLWLKLQCRIVCLALHPGSEELQMFGHLLHA